MYAPYQFIFQLKYTVQAQYAGEVTSSSYFYYISGILAKIISRGCGLSILKNG